MYCPQYVEAPPNAEAKRIFLDVPAVPCCLSKILLLKDFWKVSVCFLRLADPLLLLVHVVMRIKVFSAEKPPGADDLSSGMTIETSSKIEGDASLYSIIKERGHDRK